MPVNLRPSVPLQVRALDLEICGINVSELHRLWVVRTLQTLPLFRNLNVGRNLAPLSRLMTLVHAAAGEVRLDRPPHLGIQKVDNP